MSVTLSPIGGVAGQFFDNNGQPLSGGKIYTYAAGTTTPQACYTSAAGSTPHSNPIVLDSAGRVPGGEIWLTDSLLYKFVIETSTAILIGTYDNISGINSNFVNYTVQEEVQTATAGQTVFTLTTINYTPGTNSLTVYIDGVNQYVGTSYLETDSTTVTFTSGVHVGAEVKFTTAVQSTTGAVDASIVTYDPPFTGGVATNVEAKLEQYISVKDFGAVGDGVTNDTAAIQAAVDATPDGGVLTFMPNEIYSVSQINVTGKAICLSGYGATIDCTGVNGAVYKTDHGNKLIVEGIAFTGSGAGVKQNATIQFSSQDELDIMNCSFNMDSGVYGVYINGGRNPRIQNCFFQNSNSGNGVYFKDTVSPFVDTCTFKGQSYVGRAVYYPGTGQATDAGLILRDCEILGWDKGVEIVGCDWLVIEGCTIDYNNYSIKLGSQDSANISNNYIGSLAANPALWITYDAAGTAPNYSEKIIVVNNTFTGHYSGGNTYDCILLDGANSPDNIVISDNSFSFYTRYGINFSMNNTRLVVQSNTFSPRFGFGVSPVYNALGGSDSGITIKTNIFGVATTITDMNVSTLCKVNENYNCITEARGEAVAGGGVTTFNINHGLSYTPTKSDVSLTPTNSEAAGKNPYIDGTSSTQITVAFTSATAGTAGVAWRVRRGP